MKYGTLVNMEKLQYLYYYTELHLICCNSWLVFEVKLLFVFQQAVITCRPCNKQYPLEKVKEIIGNLNMKPLLLWTCMLPKYFTIFPLILKTCRIAPELKMRDILSACLHLFDILSVVFLLNSSELLVESL